MTRRDWEPQEIRAEDVGQVKDIMHPAPPEMRERKRQAAALQLAARVLKANEIHVPSEIAYKSDDLLSANVVDLPNAIRDLGPNPRVVDLMKLVRTCGI